MILVLGKDINEIKFYQEKLHTYYPTGYLPGQQQLQNAKGLNYARPVT